MTVADLQQFLSDLSKLLRSSQAAKVAGELDYATAKLSPFKDFNLKAFADFLEKADAYSRGALAPKPKTARAKKSKATPAEIDEACARVLSLYDRAIDPATTIEQIATAIQELEAKDVPKKKLDEVLMRMGAERPLKSKPEAVKAIRQKIMGRKGTFDRRDA